MNIFGKLRAISKNEPEIMHSWRNAPNVRANMYTQHEISREEHLAWWEGAVNRPENLYLMYEYDDRPLGVVYFNKIDKASENAAWGFYASPEAPRGTGSKMEFLALDYAFNNLRLHKLYCEVLAYNSAVIKLHGKFGFSQEGIFKEQFKRGGNYIDIYRLGMLSSDWRKVRSEIEFKITSLEKKK